MWNLNWIKHEFKEGYMLYLVKFSHKKSKKSVTDLLKSLEGENITIG